MSRSDDFHNARNAHLFGAGMDALPGAGPTAGAPFERARGGAAIGRTYDLNIVRSAMEDDHYPVSEVDPRGLSKVQPSVVRDGVAHYMANPEGQTYADQNGKAGHHTKGNKVPVVYATEDGVERVIMSGHHRATAALLSGQMLKAKVVSGPWANDLWKRRQQATAGV